MLSRLQLPKSSIWSQWFMGKWDAVQLLPEQRQLFGQRFGQLRGLKGMIDPHPQVTVDDNCCRSSATRLESDQPKVAFNCRYLISNMAINAAQTCVFKALAEVPMKVFTRRFCFKALKNSSICQRCLYTSATVAAASVRWLVRNTSTRSCSSS